jgi:hypothetical protein
MKDWIFSFALTSDPNKKTWQTMDRKKPEWLQYGQTVQTLTVEKTEYKDGRPYNIGPDVDAGERCKFWSDHAEITRN